MTNAKLFARNLKRRTDIARAEFTLDDLHYLSEMDREMGIFVPVAPALARELDWADFD